MFRDIWDGFRMLRYTPSFLKKQRVVQRDYHKLQGERLKAIVKHAYENVDFYRHKYDEAGVKPEDIKSVEDIHKLPIVTKDDIRSNFPILARNIDPKDCQIFATSGSTGSPLKIYRERIPFALPYPSGMLPKIIKPLIRNQGKLKVMTIFVTFEQAIENMFTQSMQALPRVRAIHIESIDALGDPSEHLKALERYQPNVLCTYPSVLKNITIFCRQEGNVVSPQPMALFCVGEVMDGHVRMAISEAFRGDIMNIYGATEAEIIAVECFKHEGMHIQCRSVVLELLQDGKPVPPGVLGEVVLTNLENRATPIIRYSGLGDVAVLSTRKCSCGNALPLLERVEGRTNDSVILPDKRSVHPFKLTLALEHVPSIAKFQVIQEAMDKVRVLIVSEDSRHGDAISPFREGEPLWKTIISNLRDLLGGNVSIVIEEVKDIPTLPGSQHAVVRSLVGR